MLSVVRRRFFVCAGLLIACSLRASSVSLLPSSSFLGISPQDERYYSAASIACRDGSKTFNRTRLNDGFCDCPDGTDEPGTSACPESKFYCRNIGDVPQLLFSSRVNDHICDCCDGSDEYDGGIVCRNTCVTNGTDDLNTGDGHHSTETKINNFNIKDKKIKVDLEDLLQNLEGLKIITVIELASLMGVFFLICRRTRVRMRRYLWRS
ncbi:hypothetical protein M5K25_009073 [Dendrobium thyrsiflorum]|uniref:Glucosidase II beta subunit N-terminal domain-containing protein n=1 Tax=Dendrobium thyrsiflorum TaxID=117978 RepID=A0ABD0VBK9_DENTH